MRRRATATLLACLVVAGAGATGVTPVSAASYGKDLDRFEADRADDVSGPQVHVVYAIPSDGTDRKLDTDGTLRRSVTSFQTWLESKTGGRGLRMDTLEGSLDVSFLQLSQTDAEVASAGAYVRDRLEDELELAGFDAPNKIYAVYYDGTSNQACGGGAYPPSLPGSVAAMYLKGLPNGPVPCAGNPFAGEGGSPGYMEFGMLHEVLHTMGFVPSCAPRHTRAGHVSDNPDDLMWAGDGAWLPSGYAAVQLDAARDDYVGTGSSSCMDLDKSPYLVGGTGEPVHPTQPAQAPVLSLSPAVISAGEATTVTYTGKPGTTIDILSRTQPATEFSKIGSVTLDGNGFGTSTHRPQKNTRVTARSANCAQSDNAPLIEVRSVASFNASRVGVRTYTFTGRVYPALNNRLVNLYRNGVLAAQGRSDASGIYRITKTLTGGTYTFQVRTPNDQSNLGTKSRELRLLIS